MSSGRVLVVDDEPEVTFALEVFFAGKGYQMLTALDGLQAMRLLRQQPVDLVLLDMKMPGVNGVEVLKFVHANHPETRVVVVTAYDVQFQEVVERLGVDGFLMKPFGIQSLTRMIEDILTGKKAPSVSAPPPEIHRQLLGVVPRARLLFLEPSEYTYRLKEVFFSDQEKCGGRYEVAGVYSAEEAVGRLDSFHPDILLVELSMLGPRGDVAGRVMASKAKPREIVIHGSGTVASGPQGRRTEDLHRLGVKVIQNESFTRAGLLRLNEVIQKTVLEHGLTEKRAGEDHPG